MRPNNGVVGPERDEEKLLAGDSSQEADDAKDMQGEHLRGLLKKIEQLSWRTYIRTKRQTNREAAQRQ